MVLKNPFMLEPWGWPRAAGGLKLKRGTGWENVTHSPFHSLFPTLTWSRMPSLWILGFQFLFSCGVMSSSSTSFIETIKGWYPFLLLTEERIVRVLLMTFWCDGDIMHSPTEFENGHCQSNLPRRWVSLSYSFLQLMAKRSCAVHGRCTITRRWNGLFHAYVLNLSSSAALNSSSQINCGWYSSCIVFTLWS